MNIQRTIRLALSLAGICCVISGARADTWQPDAKMLGKLGKEKTIGHLVIRPPAGFTVVTHQNQQGSTTMVNYVLCSPNKRNKLKDIVGAIGITEYSIALPTTQEDALTRLVDKVVGINVTRCIRSEPQTGEINGVSFVRIYYKGQDRKSKKMVHGFAYLAITDDRTYILESLDVEPASSRSLPIAEASIFTFHANPD